MTLTVQNQRPRRFAEHDETNMKHLFKSLNFDVIVLKNKETDRLSQDLQEIKSQIDENCDCLACVISSHGSEYPVMSSSNTSPQLRHHEVSTADVRIPTDTILQFFDDDHCPNLQGKPRMFFIQACRSTPNSCEENRVDKGFLINSVQEQVDMKDKVIDTQVVEFFDISCYEDYLVMFTCSSGKLGWSNKSGGWLMQCLHSVFNELLDTNYDDFLQILTRVCWKMARDLETHTDSKVNDRTKSAAVIYHMLTKEIHLRPKVKTEPKL
ncbi:CASP7 [Mytilus edulis]|uniref:CASP7 n=1 Tax=Mytilus edulis TaxID=6550 RepID=A0A8S3SXY1_MYTED|nr:CASP7 [Mytilus edulis]